MENLYTIIEMARREKELEMAISIRAGIAIAKLAARHVSKHGHIENRNLADYARSVFLGASKGKTWLDLEKTLDDVIRGAMRVYG